MSELISSKQLADTYTTPESRILQDLLAASLKPHKLVVGNESISLFDKAAGIKAVEAAAEARRVAERKAIAEASARDAAAKEAARVPTMKELSTQLTQVGLQVERLADAHKKEQAFHQDAVKAVEARCDEMQALVAKVLDQNVIIFRRLEVIKTMNEAMLEYITGKTTDPWIKFAQQEKQDNPEKIIKLQEPENKEPMRKPRVIIISMQTNTSTILGGEFNGALDIEIIRYNAKSLPTLQKYDHVVMVTSGMGTPAVNEVRRLAGDRFHNVKGGITELRDLLTEIYVAPTATAISV